MGIPTVRALSISYKADKNCKGNILELKTALVSLILLTTI